MALFWNLLLLLCLSASPAAAVTKYLSLTGNNSANGDTAGTAWGTFDTALSRLACGDTLMVVSTSTAYTGSNTGYFTVNGWHCTAGSPLTIKAQTDRGVWVAHDGTSAGGYVGIYVLNSSFVVIDGFRASTTDNNCESCGTSNPLAIGSSDHITVRHVTLHDNNRYYNSHILDINASTDLLIEDSEIYNFHRHGVAMQNGVYDSVVRRVYCNSHNWPATCPAHYGCTGSVAEGDPSGGDGCVAIYPGSRNTLENIISEGNGEVFEINGESEDVVDNHIFGSVTLNENIFGKVDSRCRAGCTANGTPPACGSGTGICYGRRNIVRNSVAVNPRSTMILNWEGMDTACHNCTAFTPSEGQTSQGFGDPNTSFFADNNLISNASNLAFNFFDSGSFLVRTANIVGTTATSPSSSSDFQNLTTVNPLLGSCYAYLPDGSPMLTAGIGGGRLGAHILYQYENGVEQNGLGGTSVKKLWDTAAGGRFTGCGPVIAGVSDASNSCAGVHTRLNVGTAGCPFPVGYGTPPVVNTGTLARWTFDEGSGTTYQDTSGATPSYPATRLGTATWGVAKVGSFAYSGNVTDSAASLTGSPIPDYGAAHSLCGWALVTDNTVGSNSGSFQTLLNFATDGNNGVRLLMRHNATPAGLWIASHKVGGVVTQRQTSALTFANNTWVHLCYVYTPNPSTLTLYVNGQPATTVAETVANPSNANFLGASGSSTSGNWGGRLDHWHVEGRALTQAEVTADFGGATPTRAVRHRALIK